MSVAKRNRVPNTKAAPRTRPPELAHIQLDALVVKAQAALSTDAMSSFTIEISGAIPSRPHPVSPPK